MTDAALQLITSVIVLEKHPPSKLPAHLFGLQVRERFQEAEVEETRADTLGCLLSGSSRRWAPGFAGENYFKLFSLTHGKWGPLPDPVSHTCYNFVRHATATHCQQHRSPANDRSDRTGTGRAYVRHRTVQQFSSPLALQK